MSLDYARADRIEGAGLGKPAVLETPLKRLDEGKFSVTSIADQSIDTVLQIEQFKIGLIALYGNNKSGNIRPCSPQLTGDIVWHLIRVRDGKQIASGSDQWNVNSSYRFSAIYQDAALMRSILNELLEKVAIGTMCNSGADSNQCLQAYRRVTVEPPPVEPAHSIAYCVANGELQWTIRSKCD